MNNTSVLSVAKNRVVWLDVVRFVAMFTVVCCHCADPFNFYSGEPSAELEQIKVLGRGIRSIPSPLCPPVRYDYRCFTVAGTRGDVGFLQEKDQPCILAVSSLVSAL